MEEIYAPTRFFIDQPSRLDFSSSYVIVRGWCFIPGGKSISGIRILAGNLRFPGLVGLPRPDVKKAVPDAPDDNTGFEIRAALPSGWNDILLEVQRPDGTWQKFLQRRVKVHRNWRPNWLSNESLTELIALQMPAHPAYSPRPIRAEKFPRCEPAGWPKISLVTPSFNQASYLRETIRSVLDQKITAEYVIQDGGSTDGSQEVIRQIATEQAGAGGGGKTGNQVRPITWESAPDEGQAHAIVRGFAKTSGAAEDVMAWINSDDYYLPGSLAYVADYFARHPEVDVIHGHRIVVDEDSKEIARRFMPKHDDAVLRLNDFVPQETMFWRRRIWDKVGGLDTSFKFAMDWDLLLRFQAAGAKIVRVPYFLACFRVHAAQKTSAQMHTVGQQEITRLRERTHGRPFPPEELEQNPVLLRYLRRSAFIEFLWKLGVRAR